MSKLLVSSVAQVIRITMVMHLRLSLTNRLSALKQKYKNNTEDRILKPNREGDSAGKMQVIHIDTSITLFATTV
jgi:hypothetical protein